MHFHLQMIIEQIKSHQIGKQKANTLTCTPCHIFFHVNYAHHLTMALQLMTPGLLLNHKREKKGNAKMYIQKILIN